MRIWEVWAEGLSMKPIARGGGGWRRIGVTTFLLAGLLLFAVWERQGKEEGEMPAQHQALSQVHLMVASDLHYLSPSLTDRGEYFTEMVGI